LAVKRRLAASKTPNSVPEAFTSQVGIMFFFLQHSLSPHSGFSIGFDAVALKKQIPATSSNGIISSRLVKFLITKVFQFAKLLMYLVYATINPQKQAFHNTLTTTGR